MADADDNFRKICCKTPEWVVDFEGPSFSLELEFLKETTSELAPARETSITSNTSIQADGNCETETEREVNSDSQEMQDFISEQKSSNTVKKTKSDIRALKRFCSTINETREPETMTAKELDKLLSRFLLKMSEKKMVKSTSQARSLHFKEASNATFLRRGYL